MRRRRWPQSAPRALHACQRRCRRRRGARRPPLRPPGGRYIRYSPPSGLGGRPTRRAAAALRRRCDLRQRGKRGGVSCRRRGRQGRAARRRLQRHPAVQRPCTRPHARIRGVFRARRAPRANGRGGRRRGRQWRRQRRRRRPGRGPSGRRRRRAPRRTRRYLRARSELRRVSAARRDGWMGHGFEPLGRGTPAGPLKRWPPPPPDGRRRRRTRRQRTDRRSTAPTGWERSSTMGPRSEMRQYEGRAQVWCVAKARTFLRSTRGLKRYSQRAARLPGRLTCQQEPCVRSARAGLSLRAQRSQETCRPEKWRPPGSQQIVGATESLRSASGKAISVAWWVAVHEA